MGSQHAARESAEYHLYAALSRAACCEGLSMLGIGIRAHGFAACGTRERGIEVIFRPLQQHDPQRCRRQKQSLRLLCGFDSRRVVAGEIARLQLSYPVETFRQGEGRVTGQALLERALRE